MQTGTVAVERWQSCLTEVQYICFCRTSIEDETSPFDSQFAYGCSMSSLWALFSDVHIAGNVHTSFCFYVVVAFDAVAFVAVVRSVWIRLIITAAGWWPLTIATSSNRWPMRKKSLQKEI